MTKATLMNAEVYDALKEAGASDEKARAAAQSIAHYDSRLSSMDTRLSGLTWMVGFNLVLSGGVLWQVVKLAGA